MVDEAPPPMRDVEGQSLRIAVVVASRGRPVELGQLCQELHAQTLKPTQIVLSVTSQKDLPATGSYGAFESVIGAAGLCAQRNRGLALIGPEADLIAFFDDDYVPRKDALEGCARLFRTRSDLVAANGHLVADGIHGPGLSYDEAVALLRSSESLRADEAPVQKEALYGCNMVFLASAIGGHRFDEDLPLYGWQEDIDFSARVGAGKMMVGSNAFVGVHRGVKGARVSGRKFGYSQIVNPAYLARKGTMRPAYALKIASNNLAANLVKSLRPEPWVDRRGRLLGNLIGLASLLQGRSDPRRILDI